MPFEKVIRRYPGSRFFFMHNDKLTVKFHGGQAVFSAECMIRMGDNDQLVFMSFPHHQLFIFLRRRDEPQIVVQARSLFHD